MAEEVSRSFKEDVGTISPDALAGMQDRDRLMSLASHIFLRLWTRLALETGQKLKVTPSQFEIGTYKGKMNWILNEGALADVDKLTISSVHGRGYSLVAETYELEGAIRGRVYFSLEEEEVKGRPVYVSYLVYDEVAGSFSLDRLSDLLSAALPKWTETIMMKREEPLWDYSREHFECVGV